MYNEFLSVSGELVTEKVIERSRFITTSCHAEGEEEARAFVARVSKKYQDATHNCFAFIADNTGNLLRFSDDGEPSGTAGMPILEVLKNKKLYCTAVVVTRYFGGIKLGAGGLVRAYSGCAAENLQAAKKTLYSPCVKFVLGVEYELSDAASRFISSFECNLLGTEYSSAVTYTVAVKKELADKFYSSLTDKLNGRIAINSKEDCIFAFDVN